MYIVEAESGRNANYEFSTAYNLVGSEEEISAFRKNMGSLVLAAIDKGVIEAEQGFQFMYPIPSSDHVLNRDKVLFHELIEDSPALRNDRLRTLLVSAAAGDLAIGGFWAEKVALDNFDPTGSDDINWLTKGGLLARPVNSKLELETAGNIPRMFGQESLEMELATKLGLDTAAYQYELVGNDGLDPEVISEYEHSSLGKLDDDGNFTPVVTVLHHNHPLRINSN